MRLTRQQRSELAAYPRGGFFDRHIRLARRDMLHCFLGAVSPRLSETILDVGASGDPALNASNYLESSCTHLQITALGLNPRGDTWQHHYPSTVYVQGSALQLPFDDRSFDIVYSHAVIEHVGGFDAKVRMVREAVRVARRAVWITTPNRWHPFDFHTALPLVHWLPKPLHRGALRRLGLPEFAREDSLDLVDTKELSRVARAGVGDRPDHIQILEKRFAGFTSNLLLFIHRSPENPRVDLDGLGRCRK